MSLLATLPAIAGPVDPPADHTALDRYIAWLAHEHQAALVERYEVPPDRVPMGWLPDVADIRRAVHSAPPSARARKALRIFVDP